MGLSERYRQYWSSQIVDRVRDLDPNVTWTPQIGVPFDLEAIGAVIDANQDSMYSWHAEASNYANSAYGNWDMLEYFKPGTYRFDSLMADITMKTSF